MKMFWKRFGADESHLRYCFQDALVHKIYEIMAQNMLRICMKGNLRVFGFDQQKLNIEESQVGTSNKCFYQQEPAENQPAQVNKFTKESRTHRNFFFCLLSEKYYFISRLLNTKEWRKDQV
ncbi:uncharacterized protein [Onthophagus taurus]|uniref:uncharacterized protein n=1 Tax=Onthophagus taurus TaxID=166361 RepID=UPI0039BDC09E